VYRVIGFDNFRTSNEKLATVPIQDKAAQLKLNIPAKVVRVDCVDAANHETKAIGRAYKCVASNFEDRAAMDSHFRGIGK
jgi:hypothetical protein